MRAGSVEIYQCVMDVYSSALVLLEDTADKILR